MRNAKEWEILYTEWHRYPHPEWKEKSELEELKRQNAELKQELEKARLEDENNRMRGEIDLLRKRN